MHIVRSAIVGGRSGAVDLGYLRRLYEQNQPRDIAEWITLLRWVSSVLNYPNNENKSV